MILAHFRFLPVPVVRECVRGILCAFVIVGLGLPETSAQSRRIVPLRDPAYATIKQLQRRGFLLSLRPTALPYTENELIRAVSEIEPSALTSLERGWADRLASRFVASAANPSTAIGSIAGDLRLATGNARRADPLRPLETRWETYPAGFGGVSASKGFASVSAGVQYDRFYGSDHETRPGARSTKPRIEDTYLNLDGSFGSLMLGNVSRHWGAVGEPGLVQSYNERSLNHFYVTVGKGRFSLSGFLGSLAYMELPPPYPTGAYRYVAGHRFDWRPTRKFTLSLVEAMVFSGETAGPSLKYLNPVQVFIFLTDNRPKNAEQNALISGLLWFQWRKLTVTGQLMIDDVALLDRAEPLAAAVSGSATVGGLLPSMDAGVELLASSARAYKAEQLEGGYHYEGRGLGLPYTDFVQVRSFADLYPLPSLIVSPSVTFLAQGNGISLLDRYPPDGAPFLFDGGRAIRTRLACGLSYAPSSMFRLFGDLGVNVENGDSESSGRTLTFAGSVALRLFPGRLDFVLW